MEKCSVDQIILGKEFRLWAVEAPRPQLKRKRVQLFEQLAAYKLIFAYNLFEIPGGQELCYSICYPKRGFPRGPDVHPVNGKQDSLSTATPRTQH